MEKKELTSQWLKDGHEQISVWCDKLDIKKSDKLWNNIKALFAYTEKFEAEILASLEDPSANAKNEMSSVDPIVEKFG